MKSAIVFFALVALSQGVPFERSLEGRIVNGEDVQLGEIPYQVSLQTLSDFHFCGGSVLSHKYVITAAHCVNGKYPQDIKVIAGTANLNDVKAVHHVLNIIVHKKYDPKNSWINDISLVEVVEPFIVSKTISFVPLPEKGANVPAESVATASGWGSLWPGGSSPMQLQRVNILITSQEYCKNIYSAKGYNVYDTQICARNPNVTSGVCNGDSGGPLTVEGKIVGLVSWILGACASRKYPTIYTKVSEYIDWINENAV